MTPAVLAGHAADRHRRLALTGLHTDPYRTAAWENCPRCDQATVHTVYTRGVTTAYRCRRCSRWRRVILAGVPAAR